MPSRRAPARAGAGPPRRAPPRSARASRDSRRPKREPTLDDVAKKLRPAAKRLRVGSDIFMGEPTSLADKDGIEWWGWNVQNKSPGAENKWVFVAVQKVEE